MVGLVAELTELEVDFSDVEERRMWLKAEPKKTGIDVDADVEAEKLGSGLIAADDDEDDDDDDEDDDDDDEEKIGPDKDAEKLGPGGALMP